jgi:hypothetical protein
VTREMMTGQLARMRELIDSNYHRCSKVNDCTEDRNSFLTMLKSNSKDDAERKNEILECTEKIKHLYKVCDSKTALQEHNQLKTYITKLPTEE